MIKPFLILGTLLFLTSCAGMNKMGQAASDMASGASTIENSASSIDRAIATGERVEERIRNRK